MQEFFTWEIPSVQVSLSFFPALESALSEELLHLAQTCLTATQTGPTSHDTSITGNTGSAVLDCVTE